MFFLKNSFLKGFILFFVFSLILNTVVMSFLNKGAEYLASDLLHILSAAIFNGLFEIILPSFPAILFLIPIAITDGLIGGLLSLIIYQSFNLKGRVFILVLVLLCAMFQLVVFNFIPIFTS